MVRNKSEGSFSSPRLQTKSMGVEPAWFLCSASSELSARFGRNRTAFNSLPVAVQAFADILSAHPISNPQHRLVHWRRSATEQLVSTPMNLAINSFVNRLRGASAPPWCYSAVYGNRAIKRALFIAVVSIRWCLAQLPDIRRGRIFPRSVIYFLRRGTSL